MDLLTHGHLFCLQYTPRPHHRRRLVSVFLSLLASKPPVLMDHERTRPEAATMTTNNIGSSKYDDEAC